MEDAITKKTSVVDYAVQSPESIDRLLNHALSLLVISDAIAIGDSLTAERFDLFHHFLGWSKTHAVAIWADAQIVHYDRSALSGGKQGDFSANSPTSARNQDHFIIQASCHFFPPKLIVT
jgi:hypothetical protein